MFFMTNVDIREQLQLTVCVCVCKYPRILHWRDEIQLATSEWSEPPQRRVLITNPYWSETLVWEVSRLSHPTLHLSLFISLLVYLWFLVYKLSALSSNTLYRFLFYLSLSPADWFCFTGFYALPVMLLYS